ncbi:uncharacterized protein LOC119353194 isoform X2 [Triticum dicoccoides]|uniref:uncharacterized protein LOC119353194 isoform X2 n=1 Tax=Triticum dicoccoides TaxID=85692 RepID=UPI00188EF699|nr:uncharacterized protein LOC119353194 isoform X2 [Triticum dicoccoides]
MAAVRAKAAPPTLLSLCLQAVAAHLTADAAGAGRSGGCSAHFDGFVQEHEEEGGGGHLAPEQVAEALPWELLHQLASSLPPFALELLHHGAHARCCSSTSLTDRFGKADGNRRGTKRSRCEDFNTAWQALFESRWPLHDNTGHDDLVTVDWQQQYWEKHLQECLDEAAEAALLPSFRGSIGELSMSDKIMSSVYLSENISQQYSRLSYQWTILGSYARCLRFQNVLCTAEVCDMLQHSRLEILVFVRIISEHEVNGVCLLLSCHAKTLLSLEFIHCQLYPAVMDKVCTSLCQPGSQNYKIQSISIKSSPISESKSLTTSAGLLNFLSYAKYLIPFLELALQRGNPLRRLRAENCDLSSFGVTKLLDCLASINKPLDMLSIADNHLGSSVAATLVKFLGSHVRELNVEDIGLGPIGFQILEEALPRKVKLSHINISKNRGGIGTAHFISRLILQAPNLVSVDAGSNLLPPESLEVICNALKQTTCNLTRLDLMGNLQLSSDIFPAVFEFKKRGKPILLVPLQQGSCAPYDADP